MRSVWVSDFLLAAVLAGLLVSQAGQFESASSAPFLEFLFWTVIVAAVNLLPIRVQEFHLTLDAPVLLAVALLYDPVFASLVGLIATIDARELRLEIQLSYAIFNRLQTGIAVFFASAVFHGIAESVHAMPAALLGCLAALVVDYMLNVGLVLGGYLEREGSIRRAAANLRIGHKAVFVLTYLGYGLLALVLALLFREVGAWSVISFLVPIIVARQMLLRTQKLESVTEDLRAREHLLESLFERSNDERRDERARIAAELHDGILQALTRIWMTGRDLAKRESDSPFPREEVDELTYIADEAIEDLRRLMKEIRESPLARKGLVPTLESLVRDLKLEWQKRIVFEAPSEIDLPANIQVTAYQVAREGLINALKHADALVVHVTLQVDDDEVQITVQDDGKGFDPLAARSPTHFGLELLEERVRRMDGDLLIDSKPGCGTRISATLRRAAHNAARP